jgi:erythromycin esterase
MREAAHGSANEASREREVRKAPPAGRRRFGSRCGRFSYGASIIGLTSLLLATPSGNGAAQSAGVVHASRPAGGSATAAGAAAPAVCGAAPAVPLTLLKPWNAALELGGTRCLVVTGQPGGFVRAVVEMGAEPPTTGMSVDLYASGDTAPALSAVLGNVERQPLSWEIRSGGVHYLVVRDIWTIERDVKSVPARIRLEAVEPAAFARERRMAISGDPRVQWLRANAVRINSIAPDDDDFADLAPLAVALADVRVVLLGEADHGSASDFLAKSRLVRFLHQRLGFDVLAMEAPMYDMKMSWDSLRAEAPPREAFSLGALGHWAGSAQMQPLVTYIAAHAGSERPLELAGFDNQPQRASVQYFANELARFLADRGIDTPLRRAGSAEREVLDALAEVRYRQRLASLPDSSTRRDFLRALDQAADRVGLLDDDEAKLWSQILRGKGRHARRVFASAEGISLWEAARLRNEQMGENLIWLANERYPGRKIVAWAGSAHLMRLPDLPPAAGSGPSMGMKVWEEFGEESFVIATASYQHEAGRIIPDQHALPEFEQLMASAGFDYGLVNLRSAAREGSWAGASFLARPISHRVDEAVWSDAVDALLFIRVQERWRRAPEP